MSGGKILSLDELESKIRPNSEHSVNVQQKQPPQKPDEEMTANFKRLVRIFVYLCLSVHVLKFDLITFFVTVTLLLIYCVYIPSCNRQVLTPDHKMDL